jgi:anti-anti-sigma factor
VPIIFDQGEDVCHIRVEGEVNISSAAELKRLLIAALASKKTLRLDLEQATDLDVTALQLLWAAKREAIKSAVKFTLMGRLPEEISDALRDSGFADFPFPMQPK